MTGGESAAGAMKAVTGRERIRASVSSTPVEQMPKRPRSLFPTESRLHDAFRAMDEVDPDGEMSGDQAEAFVAGFVSVDFTMARRDEFGDYLVEMSALADGKRAAAKVLLEQAERITNGLERMRETARKNLEALGVSDIRGHHRRLLVKRSPGSVDVFDEGAVPLEFRKVKEDQDLEACRVLARTVAELGDLLAALVPDGSVTPSVVRAAQLLEEVTARRRSVDKVKVRDRWKTTGDAEAVPGCRKKVTSTLEVR